ncbi:TetR/AcrR family transcriptional regulator [Adhaeribacter swui]|uniref:TetR/AcrR family transcriptional regulator n=1 Tax=Adhaeribacter swui TaxID=2086471 RepID=A0A7G7GAP3_9BACT|nr:TetR/AcrR family transcriptional regulator [Adhaeribacter swui]QNF34227.1 TetR/AcrR family transcriptional regulator [Adhaeribacter swui]
MNTVLKINLNHKSYLRNPEETALGKKIIAESIRLIDYLGFEEFTFKKLAQEINSTEASVYRYFENKHKLLIYLVSYYWVWLDYQISFQTNNILDPAQRLGIIIRILTEASLDNLQTTYIDEAALHRIVIADAAKAYLTKGVDEDNKAQFFQEYKTLCRKIATVLLEIAPDYPYPHTLISTIMEATHQQTYFVQHLPALTDIKSGENVTVKVADFLKHLVFAAIAAYKI